MAAPVGLGVARTVTRPERIADQHLCNILNLAYLYKLRDKESGGYIWG